MDESGTPRRKGIAQRTVIRYHARRHHTVLGKKDIGRSNLPERASVVRDSTVVRRTLRPRLLHEGTSTFDAVKRDAVDPFRSLPILQSQQVKVLLHHCKYCSSAYVIYWQFAFDDLPLVTIRD